MSNDNDARDFTRVPVEVKAVIVSNEGNAQGVVTDLSLSGAFVHTGEAPGRGAHVDLNLLLTMGDEPLVIETKGRVSRREEEGAAIDFTAVVGEGVVHLQRLVLYNAPDPGRVEEEQRHSLGIRRVDDASDF
jgi:hypothetical protein